MIQSSSVSVKCELIKIEFWPNFAWSFSACMHNSIECQNWVVIIHGGKGCEEFRLIILNHPLSFCMNQALNHMLQYTIWNSLKYLKMNTRDG